MRSAAYELKWSDSEGDVDDGGRLASGHGSPADSGQHERECRQSASRGWVEHVNSAGAGRAVRNLCTTGVPVPAVAIKVDHQQRNLSVQKVFQDCRGAKCEAKMADAHDGRHFAGLYRRVRG